MNYLFAAEDARNGSESGSGGYLCVTGVHGVMEAQQNSQFKKMLDHAMLVVPDGVPTVSVGMGRFQNIGGIFGPDLMFEVCRSSVFSGHTIFSTVASRESRKSFAKTSNAIFPASVSSGLSRPPFRSLNLQEKADLQDHVHRCPRISSVWSKPPKQESSCTKMSTRLIAK